MVGQEPSTHKHFLLHKPYGFVSQFVYPHKRKKGLLGQLYDFPPGTMAIGRLDVKSEGLLLLTTDGKLSAEIRSKLVEKEYYVQVDGVINPEAAAHLEKGIAITVDKQKQTVRACKSAVLDLVPNFNERPVKIRDARHGPTSWITVTLTEGKFHQVRKMTAAVGFPTLRLIRMRIGRIHLGQLQPGEVVAVDRLDY
ncbi:MAG: pseudouridine synthase [Candidatus Cyclobacteriaceae bacterium M3_2C_046]